MGNAALPFDGFTVPSSDCGGIEGDLDRFRAVWEKARFSAFREHPATSPIRTHCPFQSPYGPNGLFSHFERLPIAFVLDVSNTWAIFMRN
jgi:hypothetical protein